MRRLNSDMKRYGETKTTGRIRSWIRSSRLRDQPPRAVGMERCRVAEPPRRVVSQLQELALAVLIVALSASAWAQTPLKKGQILTLKIPSNLLTAVGGNLETEIGGSDTELTIQGRADWEQCCMPSLIEVEIKEVDKPKRWRPTTQVLTYTRPGMGIVYLNFAPAVQNIERALSLVAIAGPAKSATVAEYSARRYDAMATGGFTGPLAAANREQKLATLRFVVGEAKGVGVSTDVYKDQVYLAIDLGESETIFNTLQLNEPARTSRIISRSLLKILKSALPYVSALGDAVHGIRLDTKVLHRNFVRDELSKPESDTLRLYASLDSIRKFATADTTSQELVDGSVILVNDNRVRVVLAAQ